MASFGERLLRILRGASSGGRRPLGEADPDDLLRQAAPDDSPGASPRASGKAGPAPPTGGAADLQRAYANLELTAPSTLEEAKAAWRRLMLRFHPDHFQGDAAKAEKATQVAMRLTEAYRVVREHLERA